MPCQSGCLRVLGEVTRRWVDATYPWNVSPSGCFNPGATLDDNITPSPHAKGEAIDIGIKPPFRGRASAGQEIFRFLHTNRARLGIVQLIWDGQIWSATNQPSLIRPYTVNPHRDHIHCQFNPAAARNAGLTIGAGAAPVPPAEEDDTVKVDAFYTTVKPGSKRGGAPNVWFYIGPLGKKVFSVDGQAADLLVKAGWVKRRDNPIVLEPYEFDSLVGRALGE